MVGSLGLICFADGLRLSMAGGLKLDSSSVMEVKRNLEAMT